MNQRRAISISLIIALVGLPQISETIYTPALPSIAAGLSTTPNMVEASLTTYFLGFAIGVSLWGILSDLYGRKKMLILGLFFYIAGTLLCMESKNVEALLLYRIIQAFGASVGSIITQTMLRDIYDGSERSKIFAIVGSALAFCPAIGPLLGGFISEFWGWQANFLCLTFIAIPILLWSFISLPETRPSHIIIPTTSEVRKLFSSMMQSYKLWGHILLIGSTNGIIFGFYQEAPFVFIEQLGLSPHNYGCIGLLIAAATIIAAHLSFLLSKRTSGEKSILIGACSVVTGGFFFISMVHVGMILPSFLGIALSCGSFFTIFFGIGLIIPNSLHLALKPYQSSIGTAGSLFSGCYYCFIAAYTWLMSAIHNGTAWPLATYITALGLLLLLGTYLVNSSYAESEKVQS